MSDRPAALEGDDLVPTNDVLPDTSLPNTNPLGSQTVTAPALTSSQPGGSNIDPFYANLPLGLQPSAARPRDDAPPGHVRLLGGFMCPVDPVDPVEPEEDDDTETSVYYLPAGILDDDSEFPSETTEDDAESEHITSPNVAQRPMLHLRDVSTPTASSNPTSSPFQGYSSLYQGNNSFPSQSVVPEYLQPIDLQTRLRMAPHHAMNPPSTGFVQPIIPYHPTPIVPGFPEPIGPPPAQPMVYYHPESDEPNGEALGPQPNQPMIAHHAEPNNPNSPQPSSPHDPQAVAVYHPQRIGSLGEMLSLSPKEIPTPTPPHRRRSTITFNPEATEFTPSPTCARMANARVTESALSPTPIGTTTYEATEFTYDPTNYGMTPCEEAGVEGFVAQGANVEASMAEILRDTWKEILSIDDERDREDAVNDFYIMQARPWTDEDTRREKEEKALEERKRRFAPKK
ncbi:hypothetical protein FANTH_7606 [Fusarium anthophilum]|uniref:Uncharacterized protein n=1 Tax=Fusarium anthophilum TaxID=48485 RepID=A0A8H4ZE42_9HYPO|nr:hypothetical protein FANTH_7606 [Fusarium anthophilum]